MPADIEHLSSLSELKKLELPSTAAEVRVQFLAIQQRICKDTPDESKSDIAVEQELENLFRSFPEKIRITLVDDESMYKTVLIEHFKGLSNDLFQKLDIVTFDNTNSALTDIESMVPHFCIFDVDLGSHSLNGFELTEKVRSLRENTFICIHSNRILHTDYKEAIDRGADAFLPKPMARIQCWKLLCQALRKWSALHEEAENVQIESATKVISKEPLFVFVDDSRIFRAMWQHTWTFGKLVTFECPREFFARIENEPDFLKNVSGVITDFHFGSAEVGTDGYDFAQKLRKLALHMPIGLASNGDYSAKDFAEPVFSAFFSKDVPEKRVLEEFVR